MLATLKTRAAALISNPSAANQTAYDNAVTPIENYLSQQTTTLRSKEAEVKRIYDTNKDHISSVRSRADNVNRAATNVKQDAYVLDSLEESVKTDYTPVVVKGLIVAVLAGISVMLLG